MPDIARGIKLRIDLGSQYRVHQFQGSLNWFGVEDAATFVGEPKGNEVAEQFIPAFKEQCLGARRCNEMDDLRQAIATFSETYNNQWLVERLGHCAPREAFNEATDQVAA